MAVELADAYVSLVPTARGIGQQIQGQLQQSGLQQEAERSGDDAAEGWGGKFKAGLAVAAGAAAAALGVVIAGVFKAMDFQQDNARLAAQLGLDPNEAAKAGKIAGQIYAQNYGESLAGVNDAIKSVVQNGLVDDVGQAGIDDLTKSALNLASVFDLDVADSTRAVAQLMRTGLVDSAQEAFDVITRGEQLGADKAGDLLDTFNEYPTQFRKLGLDAQDALGLIQQGLKGGARDSDLVADSLKEFSIRAVDGSKLTAEGFKAIGLNADEMAEKVGRGGADAREGLDQVLDGLRAIEDPVARSQAAVALFGTQAEDMGQSLFDLDLTRTADELGEVAGATQRAGDTMSNTASSNIESFKRQLQVTFVDLLGGQVLPWVQRAAEYISTNWGPAIQQAGQWLQANLVPAIQAAGEWISGTLIPALAQLWDWFSTKILPVLADATAAIGQTLYSAFQTISKAISDNQDELSTLWGWIQKVAEIIVTYLVPAYEQYLKRSIESAVGAIRIIIEVISTFVSAVQFAGSVVATVFGGIQSAVGYARDFIGQSVDAIAGFFSGIGDRIGGAVEYIAGKILSPFKSAFNSIATAWNSTVGQLSFTIPSWVPGIGGDGWSAPQIPTWRAKGGPVRAGDPYFVGEQGMELFKPRTAGTIMSNRDTVKLLQSGSDSWAKDNAQGPVVGAIYETASAEATAQAVAELQWMMSP